MIKLLELSKEVANGIEKREPVHVDFLDFWNAFDKGTHDLEIVFSIYVSILWIENCI